MEVGGELRRFDARRRNDRCGRSADERGMLGRAAVPLKCRHRSQWVKDVLGERLVVVQPVHDISRARKQQRQQREQRYDAVVAVPANAVRGLAS